MLIHNQNKDQLQSADIPVELTLFSSENTESHCEGDLFHGKNCIKKTIYIAHLMLVAISLPGKE